METVRQPERVETPFGMMGSCEEGGLPHPTFLTCKVCGAWVCAQHQAVHGGREHDDGHGEVGAAQDADNDVG